MNKSFKITSLKNNYNFDVVKLHLKFNQRTNSTPHKFQTRFDCSKFNSFSTGFVIQERKRLKMSDLFKINVQFDEKGDELEKIISYFLRDVFIKHRKEDECLKK